MAKRKVHTLADSDLPHEKPVILVVQSGKGSRMLTAWTRAANCYNTLVSFHYLDVETIRNSRWDLDAFLQTITEGNDGVIFLSHPQQGLKDAFNKWDLSNFGQRLIILS
jgi:hypothetical protein